MCFSSPNWGPKLVFLLLTTFQKSLLLLFVLFPGFIITLGGEKQGELGLCHLVQTDSALWLFFFFKYTFLFCSFYLSDKEKKIFFDHTVQVVRS